MDYELRSLLQENFHWETFESSIMKCCHRWRRRPLCCSPYWNTTSRSWRCERHSRQADDRGPNPRAEFARRRRSHQRPKIDRRWKMLLWPLRPCGLSSVEHKNHQHSPIILHFGHLILRPRNSSLDGKPRSRRRKRGQRIRGGNWNDRSSKVALSCHAHSLQSNSRY